MGVSRLVGNDKGSTGGYAGMPYSGRTRPVPAGSRKSALQPVGSGESVAPAPQEDWIEIPVPAIVRQEVYDAAQQRLDENKQMARRNNHKHDYLLRALVSCGQLRNWWNRQKKENHRGTETRREMK